MTPSSTETTLAPPSQARGFGWTPYVVLAFVALWPTVGPAEVVLSLGAIASIAILVFRRFRNGTALLSREAWALITVLFLCYWLPEFFSAFDSFDPPRSWREVLLDLRYLPFLWLAAMAVARRRDRRFVLVGVAIIASVWTLDACMQASVGWSLGGANVSDRLTGVFGAGNQKLGPVLASLLPFVLAEADRRWRGAGWVAAATVSGGVILLAGSRASWLVYLLVILIAGWHRFGRRRLLLSLTGGMVLASVLAMSLSSQFVGRIDRSMAALSGDRAGLDVALAGRLSIWHASLGMIAAHPINGVGIRSFRDVYADYAAPDDFFLRQGEHGALFAHQIVLEVLSETGGIGLAFWLLGVALAQRAWHWALAPARQRATVAMQALLVTVFPLNTHLAFYSTFWGGVFLLLLALFAGTLFAQDDDAAPAA
jgi:O-antigen ligase